jgi:hypothetical protein
MLDKLYEVTQKGKTAVTENKIEKVEKPINIKKNIKTAAKTVKDERTVSAPQLADIKSAIIEIINDRSHDGWAYYAEVVPQLEKKYPQFNYKLYGTKGKQDFFKTLIGCEMKTDGSSVMIKLK